MQVRLTSAAADDLENIANYLFEKTPENTAHMIREIYTAPTTLKGFPNRGRAGEKEETRELVMTSLPCVIVYQIRGDTAHIVGILHSSQDLPKHAVEDKRLGEKNAIFLSADCQ